MARLPICLDSQCNYIDVLIFDLTRRSGQGLIVWLTIAK